MRVFHSVSMRHLRLISHTITLAGAATFATSLILGLSALWTVIGMMLLVAGIIKIVTVHLLVTVAGFGTAEVPVPTKKG